MNDDKAFVGDLPSHAFASEETDALVAELFDLLDGWANRYELSRRTAHGEQHLRQTFKIDNPIAERRVDVAFGELAAAYYAERRRRDRVFDDPQLFGEPAWDILLDVASAEARGERLQVTSVCIGACVPETTALRWIGVLEKRGLVRKEHDLSDQRRSFVRLTVQGAKKLRMFFSHLPARPDLLRARHQGPLMLNG